MDRTRFFKIAEVDDIQQFDFLWSNFDKFTMTSIPFHYRITQADIMRPDMVSYKMYGSVGYWWVLLLVNECDDVFSQMNVGDVWTVPALSDINDFYRKYRIR